MPSIKISKKAVDKAAVPERGDAYYWDDTLSGFGLRVTPKGVRSYVIQYRMRGKPARRMTLGIHGKPWTPDQARSHAEQLLINVKRGIDPVETQKRKERDARTLGLEGWLDHFTEHCLKVEWPDSWQGARRTLELHVLPHWKGKGLPEITADDVADVIDPLRPRKPLARKVWAVLSRFFSFAVEDRKLAKADNPMDGVRAPPSPDQRKRVLSADEITAAWLASYKLPDPREGAFVRLLFCTLQRRTEVSGLPWKELDPQRSLWLVDAERAKNDQDSLVPLNALAMAELSGIGWKRRGFVFPTVGGQTSLTGYSKLKKRLDALMLPILQEMADRRAAEAGEEPDLVTLERWTLHDIRRTGSTSMQSFGVPVEVTERCIGHKSGQSQTGVAKVYNLWAYEPEKREAFAKWSSYLSALAAGVDGETTRALVRAGLDVRAGSAVIESIARDVARIVTGSESNVIALAARRA